MNFFDYIKNKEFFQPHGKCSESEIKNAENALGVLFSSEYKLYVSNCRYASWFGHELTGISNLPNSDVIKVTEMALKMNNNIPSGFYVVEALNIDNCYIWQNYNGEVFLSRYNFKPKKVATSLVEYFHFLEKNEM